MPWGGVAALQPVAASQVEKAQGMAGGGGGGCRGNGRMSSPGVEGQPAVALPSAGPLAVHPGQSPGPHMVPGLEASRSAGSCCREARRERLPGVGGRRLRSSPPMVLVWEGQAHNLGLLWCLRPFCPAARGVVGARCCCGGRSGGAGSHRSSSRVHALAWPGLGSIAVGKLGLRQPENQAIAHLWG